MLCHLSFFPPLCLCLGQSQVGLCLLSSFGELYMGREVHSHWLCLSAHDWWPPTSWTERFNPIGLTSWSAGGPKKTVPGKEKWNEPPRVSHLSSSWWLTPGYLDLSLKNFQWLPSACRIKRTLSKTVFRHIQLSSLFSFCWQRIKERRRKYRYLK